MWKSSSTCTSAAARRASIAAEIPPAPEPTTTTSASSSQPGTSRRSSAIVGVERSAVTPAAASPAPVRNPRRVCFTSGSRFRLRAQYSRIISSEPNVGSQALAASDRVRQRAAVHVLEFAADWHAVRDSRRGEAVPRDNLTQEVRGGLALDRWIGGKDHLCDLALAKQPLQRLDADLVRPDAIERRQMSHQYEIAAAIARRLLDGNYVRRRLHDTQQAAVTLVRRADRAELALGEHPAPATVTEAVDGAGDRLRKLAATDPFAFEQMECHALRRLGAHAGQAAQRLDQAAQGRRIEHRLRVSRRTAASCPAGDSSRPSAKTFSPASHFRCDARRR